MQVHELLGDGKAKARSWRGFFLSPEGLEDQRTIGFRDSFAVVGHLNDTAVVNPDQYRPLDRLGSKRISQGFSHSESNKRPCYLLS